MIKRVLSVGDIHGHYDKLMAMMDKIQYKPDEDVLIFHGDYVDRGTQNLAVLYKIMELKKQGAICLKGNHEWFTAMALHDICFGYPMYDKPFELENFYFRFGGKETYDELMKLSSAERLEIYNFINDLPKYATVDRYIFVHGGVNPSKMLEKNTLDEIVLPGNNFIWIPTYKDKIVVFGHTPTWNMRLYGQPENKNSSKIWYDSINKDKIGIDCGCGLGGRLACIDLVSGTEYYV